jgi:hypothetical protein
LLLWWLFMLFRSLARTGLFIFPLCMFASLISAQSLAQAINDQDSNDEDFFPPVPSITSTKSSPVTPGTKQVHVRLGSGLGVFQDLQVPVDNDAGLRIDGTVPSEGENTTHSGFPVFAGLGFVWPRASVTYGVNFEALQVEATSGNPATRNSSYARIEAKPGATWSFNVFDQAAYIGASLALRRSLYKNVSDGHYADSAVTRATIGLEAPGEARIESFAGYAPVSRFSYDTGKGFQTTTMGGTTTAAYEFGVGVNYRIWNTTWFDFTAEQEVVSVDVQNTKAYEVFGLAVAPTQETSRRYHLQTTLLRIALHRVF